VPALCWGLVVVAPVAALGLVAALVADTPAQVPPSAWAGLAYASAVRMFLGSVLWYGGLARGGTARIGQLNLAQPLLAIVWSALLLGERIGWAVPMTALIVVAAMGVCLHTGPGRKGGNQVGERPRTTASVTAKRFGKRPRATARPADRCLSPDTRPCATCEARRVGLSVFARAGS
jgi:uncharacterized membrane protein